MKQKKKVPCMVHSRVVGYISIVDAWNIGKKQGFKDRKMYSVKNAIERMDKSEGG